MTEKLLLAVYTDLRFVQLRLVCGEDTMYTSPSQTVRIEVEFSMARVTLVNLTLVWLRVPVIVIQVAASTPDATEPWSTIHVLVRLFWPESLRVPVIEKPIP